MRRYQACTCCQNDVVLTSMRRHYVTSTSIQRHFYVMCLQGRMYGWMICEFTSFSTVFQSYQDDRSMIMKGCVQWKTRLRLERISPQTSLGPGPLSYRGSWDASHLLVKKLWSTKVKRYTHMDRLENERMDRKLHKYWRVICLAVCDWVRRK